VTLSPQFIVADLDQPLANLQPAFLDVAGGLFDAFFQRTQS
jgi:hypothetical protein